MANSALDTDVLIVGAGPVPATPAKLRVSIVVGCDGAYSAVRHQLNLPFEGAEYRGWFLLAYIPLASSEV